MWQPKEIADKQLSNQQQRWLNHALRIAECNENTWQHGAVLVKGGRIIASAPNIYKNRPSLFLVEYREDVEAQKRAIREHCSIHAEAKVVKMAGAKAKGSTVYVARAGKNGEAMMSKPCGSCKKMLNAAGVAKVVYTTGEAWVEEMHRRGTAAA